MTASLAKNPSVAGPEYFNEGWTKVMNASKPLYPIFDLKPDGITNVFAPVLSFP